MHSLFLYLRYNNEEHAIHNYARKLKKPLDHVAVIVRTDKQLEQLATLLTRLYYYGVAELTLYFLTADTNYIHAALFKKSAKSISIREKDGLIFMHAKGRNEMPIRVWTNKLAEQQFQTRLNR